MNASDYLQILWRRKWIIVFTILIALLVVEARTALIKPLYTASTTLRISTVAIGSTDYVQYDLTYTDRLMNTYAKLVTSTPIMDELTRQLSLSTPPKIIVNIVANTELMQIAAEAGDPAEAQKIADTLAQIFISEADKNQAATSQSTTDALKAQLDQAQQRLTSDRAQYDRLSTKLAQDDQSVINVKESVTAEEQAYTALLDQYAHARSGEAIRQGSLSIVEPATPPVLPSSPNQALNLVLGLVIGGAAGIALAFLFDNLDPTLYTSKQIEMATGVPPLAKVPTVRRGQQIAWPNIVSPQTEAYRSLRTNIFGAGTEGPRAVVVTSSEPGAGKSTVVANLAIALAQGGRRVILIDANLRRPVQHNLFGLNNDLGLSNYLNQEAQLLQVLQSTSVPGLVLLVVKRSQAKADDVQAAYQQLLNAQANIVGVVVNRAERSSRYKQYVPRALPVRR